MAARETCPPIPREGSWSQFLGDELTQMADSLCQEGEPPCGESESPDEETFPSIQHQIPGMITANISTHSSNISTHSSNISSHSSNISTHRKALSLDYRTGDMGTRQSLSGSLCALSQAGVSERAVVVRCHPCTDRQWGSSSFIPMRALVPPLPTTPGDWRASSTPVVRRRTLSHSSTEHDRQAQEQEGDTQRGGTLQVTPPMPTPLLIPAGERRLSKRERNRLKILRRKQRRRERWVHCQLQENTQQSSSGNATGSSEEDEEECFASEKEGFICAVCLDVYYCPYMCHPCSHVFCEPCLRTLARPSPARTPCPLCRTLISHVFFQKELNHTTRTFFPDEYQSRKQNFHRACCSKWPLPSCRKRFRIFGGFRRQASPIAQRQFPHSGYPLDALDLEDDARGWRFDMDMVIIYIYSVNWVIGFIALCFLCYFLFPSL